MGAWCTSKDNYSSSDNSSGTGKTMNRSLHTTIEGTVDSNEYRTTETTIISFIEIINK